VGEDTTSLDGLEKPEENDELEDETLKDTLPIFQSISTKSLDLYKISQPMEPT
jgi:hypothetical protein